MRRSRAARTSVLAVMGAAVALVPGAAGADGLSQARAAVGLARTPEGMQSRYDAGRHLEVALYSARRGCRAELALARGLVRWAEGYAHPSRGVENGGRRLARKALADLSKPCRPSRISLPRSRRLPRVPPLLRAAAPRARVAQLDARFADLLYENVLHRAPDDAGASFWRHALEAHAADRTRIERGGAVLDDLYAYFRTRRA